MHVRSRLIDTRVPDHPQGVALVLHGGASRGGPMAVSPTQLSVLRMLPIAGRLALVGRGRLAVLRLLNSVRGWDAHHTPVDDVRWALGQVRERFGTQVPVALVGHSLGGRAALLAAAEPQVASVVALAAWLYPQEPVGPLTGRRVLFVHGDHDRIARLPPAVAAARRLARSTDVGFVTVRGGKHAMLHRHRTFDGVAADWVAATLFAEAVDGPVRRILDGDRWVEV